MFLGIISINTNVASSKHASLHDAINMDRELIEQAIQAKATRIGESIKRKWKNIKGTTETTITTIPIIGSRTGSWKLPKLMLLPQMEERFILGIYHYATDVSYITTTSAQLSTKNAKG
ncbi:hypothetical protein Tco_1471120 [Tanacetum coccineum]